MNNEKRDAWLRIYEANATIEGVSPTSVLNLTELAYLAFENEFFSTPSGIHELPEPLILDEGTAAWHSTPLPWASGLHGSRIVRRND